MSPGAALGPALPSRFTNQLGKGVKRQVAKLPLIQNCWGSFSPKRLGRVTRALAALGEGAAEGQVRCDPEKCQATPLGKPPPRAACSAGVNELAPLRKAPGVSVGRSLSANSRSVRSAARNAAGGVGLRSTDRE